MKGLKMKNKGGDKIIRGTTKRTGGEIFAMIDQFSDMEPVFVERSLARKIEQGAKRLKVSTGQYASALLDAQLNSKTNR
ncbi:MAG: hypothetical protein HY280_07685 [Nitrospinae bacterium]|nr:hypothetical protein [Nitrospinota bacterium]